MSDDLKSRLRSVGGVRHDGATRWYINPDGPEAVEYIEKLEEALRKISGVGDEAMPSINLAKEAADLWVCLAMCVDVARIALEGKDD